ncbi:MAG: hypothetical protein KME23_19050 [Goleter apudmare HA4340-LM2]|jgi:hypothetical protein|nr:hypothetical protein [Goleter apudmare HA4340-LM2]
MNKKSPNFPKPVGVLSAICGGLLMSLPLFTQVVKAQQLTPQVNPCPRIFYEEPHNNRVLVPQGCPPNAFTQQLLNQGLITPSPDQIRMGVGGEAPPSVLNPNPRIFQEAPYNRSQQPLTTPSAVPVPPVPRSSVIQPPLPGQQQSPIATVLPTNNVVNVRLVNDSGANITYQIIGDTAPRSLPGRSNTTLKGLRTPITVTFYREDGGLVAVAAQRTSQQGTLSVTLRETTEVGKDRGTLRIAENGSVFLN